MVKKSSKKKNKTRNSFKLIKEYKEKQKFINETEKKIKYFSKQLSRAKTSLEKIDTLIDKNT